MANLIRVPRFPACEVCHRRYVQDAARTNIYACLACQGIDATDLYQWAFIQEYEDVAEARRVMEEFGPTVLTIGEKQR